MQSYTCGLCILTQKSVMLQGQRIARLVFSNFPNPVERQHVFHSVTLWTTRNSAWNSPLWVTHALGRGLDQKSSPNWGQLSQDISDDKVSLLQTHSFCPN